VLLQVHDGLRHVLAQTAVGDLPHLEPILRNSLTFLLLI
jgi:hypothetical protein